MSVDPAIFFFCVWQLHCMRPSKGISPGDEAAERLKERKVTHVSGSQGGGDGLLQRGCLPEKGKHAMIFCYSHRDDWSHDSARKESSYEFSYEL